MNNKTTIKAEGPGSNLDKAISEILFQLETKTQTPDQKQQTIQQVQIELSKILPNGVWHDKTTRQQFEAEIKRVREQQEQERTEESTSLRASIRNKQTENK